MSMSSTSNSIVSKNVFWNVINDTVKSLLSALALALALQFKASKWPGQGLKCQGQGQG